MTSIVRFKCQKDFIMEEGYRAFTAGKFYMFTHEGDCDLAGLDDQGDDHRMHREWDLFPYFSFDRVIE